MTTAKVMEALSTILAKLEVIEKHVAGPSAKVAKTSAEAILRERLDRLTLKRHAVLTATLGGVGYQELAKIMQCDVTTVKLHLKAVLTALEMQSRSVMLASHSDILNQIPEKEYHQRYGVGKRWWLEQDDKLMAVLRAIKPPANQHTRS